MSIPAIGDRFWRVDVEVSVAVEPGEHLPIGVWEYEVTGYVYGRVKIRRLHDGLDRQWNVKTFEIIGPLARTRDDAIRRHREQVDRCRQAAQSEADRYAAALARFDSLFPPAGPTD